jgi:hypothetical protein
VVAAAMGHSCLASGTLTRGLLCDEPRCGLPVSASPDRDGAPADVNAARVRPADDGLRRLRVLAASSAGVYLAWWFMVQLLLPPSFNPLPGRLLVVALNALLVAASTRSAWVRRRFSVLYTTWLCILVAHYCYLIAGNNGDSTWWMGALVTFAAASMCAQSPRDVAAFSVFSLGCAVAVAAREGKLGDSIYVPGLATILLLANITKRNQLIAQDATLRAALAQETGSSRAGTRAPNACSATWRRR